MAPIINPFDSAILQAESKDTKALIMAMRAMTDVIQARLVMLETKLQAIASKS